MHTTILFKLSVVRHVLCDISKIENNKFERALECKIKNAKKIPLLTYLSSFLRPPPKKKIFLPITTTKNYNDRAKVIEIAKPCPPSFFSEKTVVEIIAIG